MAVQTTLFVTDVCHRNKPVIRAGLSGMECLPPFIKKGRDGWEIMPEDGDRKERERL